MSSRSGARVGARSEPLDLALEISRCDVVRGFFRNKVRREVAEFDVADHEQAPLLRLRCARAEVALCEAALAELDPAGEEAEEEGEAADLSWERRAALLRLRIAKRVKWQCERGVLDGPLREGEADERGECWTAQTPGEIKEADALLEEAAAADKGEGGAASWRAGVASEARAHAMEALRFRPAHGQWLWSKKGSFGRVMAGIDEVDGTPFIYARRGLVSAALRRSADLCPLSDEAARRVEDAEVGGAKEEEEDWYEADPPDGARCAARSKVAVDFAARRVLAQMRARGESTPSAGVVLSAKGRAHARLWRAAERIVSRIKETLVTECVARVEEAEKAVCEGEKPCSPNAERPPGQSLACFRDKLAGKLRKFTPKGEADGDFEEGECACRSIDCTAGAPVRAPVLSWAGGRKPVLKRAELARSAPEARAHDGLFVVGTTWAAMAHVPGVITERGAVTSAWQDELAGHVLDEEPWEGEGEEATPAQGPQAAKSVWVSAELRFDGMLGVAPDFVRVCLARCVSLARSGVAVAE